MRSVRVVCQSKDKLGGGDKHGHNVLRSHVGQVIHTLKFCLFVCLSSICSQIDTVNGCSW